MSAPPPILTLTGNLLCERTMEFAGWSAGQIQRATRESFQVGGKGINVSKMLHRLGAASTALCFAGGATGAECEAWLRRQPFPHHVFPSRHSTRTALVVRSAGQPETTFMGRDAEPDPAAIRACAAHLGAQPAGGVLAVCGSIPGWETADLEPLREAFARWTQRGILAVDSYGPPLAHFVTQPLALVKINAAELRMLFPGPSAGVSTRELLEAARQRWAPRRWIVTDGSSPVWFCPEEGPPLSVAPPAVTEVSATGSGDVFFACVLEACYGRGLSLAEAVNRALPHAAANAAHPGIAEFPLA